MPSALVTGGSSGIGLAIARMLHEEGFSLTLAARKVERLEAAAAELRSLGAPEVRVVVADLATREGALHLLDDIAANSITISTLVNNAGFGLTGSFLGQDEAELLEMVELNVTTLTLLTRRLVPAMVAAGSGAVLNLSSVAGFQPGPFMAVYYATKAYVLSFTEALHSELASRGIKVTVLCPGPVPTEFAARAGISDRSMAPSLLTKSADDVAEAGYRGLMEGRRTVVPGFINNLVIALIRFLPRQLLLRVVDSRQRRRSAQGT